MFNCIFYFATWKKQNRVCSAENCKRRGRSIQIGIGVIAWYIPLYRNQIKWKLFGTFHGWLLYTELISEIPRLAAKFGKAVKSERIEQPVRFTISLYSKHKGSLQVTLPKTLFSSKLSPLKTIAFFVFCKQRLNYARLVLWRVNVI